MHTESFYFAILQQTCRNSEKLWSFLRLQDTDGVNLVEYLPLLVGDSKFLGCLDGPSQLARPHLQIRQIVLVDELFQRMSELRLERDTDGFFFFFLPQTTLTG